MQMKNNSKNENAIDYLIVKYLTGSQILAPAGFYNARVGLTVRYTRLIVIFLTGRQWPFKHVVIK